MIIALVLLFIALALYYIAVKPFNFWANTGVKCLTPPNLWGAIRGTFCLDLDDVYIFAPGETYIGITTLSGPMIGIRDPDLIKVVLSNEDNNFLDRGFPTMSKTANPLLVNPFLADGPKWKYLHTKLTPGMTPRKLKGIFDITKEVVERMVDIVSPYADTPQTVDLNSIVKRCTADILYGVAFGSHSNIMTEPANMFYKMLQNHFKVTRFKSFYLTLLISFPWLEKVLPYEPGRRALMSYFLEPFMVSLQERKKSGVKRDDFIDFYLRIQNSEIEKSKNGGGDVEFTDLLIAATVWGFFTAGSESSGHVTAGALVELANDIAVQQRVRQEVKLAIAQHGGLTYEAIKGLPYTEQVAYEALRMYPTAKVLRRRTLRKYALPDGRVTLPAGTRVLINFKLLQRDPQYYPDPNKFDPDRFSPERRKQQNKYVFLSFGEGPRKCFGARMAMNQLKLILASLLSRFEIRMKPGIPYPPEMIPDTVFSTLKHGAPVYLTRI